MGWREGFLFGDVAEDLARTGLKPRRPFSGIQAIKPSSCHYEEPCKEDQ